MTFRPIISLLLVFALMALNVDACGQATSRTTYKALLNIQELIEEERLDEALAQLEELTAATTDKPYDHAVANQYLAHTSVMLGNMQQARVALENALAMPGLPDTLKADLNLFYGTVLLGEEEYDLARKALEGWLASAEKPRPNQLFSVAYANYLAGYVPRSEELIERAIYGSDVAPERWYQVYYQILVDRKKYDAGEAVLLGLLERSPRHALYWRMLGSHHLQIERSSEGLAAMMVAYINKLLDSENDRQQIVSLYSYIDAPERGATLLESWLDNETLSTDVEQLNQLANLWLLARERQKAKEVLQRAFSMGADSRTLRLLGGIYFEDEDWSQAYSIYDEALQREDNTDDAYISMLAGISAFHAGMHDEARAALEAAAESPQYAPQIKSFLKQLEK